MSQNQTHKERREFQTVTIEGKSQNDDNVYRIYGLPEGENFRDIGSYDVIEATSLKINGYAFAASGMEIGEYQKSVTVEYDNRQGIGRVDIFLRD